MLIISILLIIISIILIIYNVYSIKNIHKINKEIDIENTNKEKELNSLRSEFNKVNSEINLSKERLEDIQNNIVKTTENQKELSRKAFENYFQLIEKEYEDYEKEFEGYNETLEAAYANRQVELLEKVNQVQKELDKLSATRAAAIQAQLKEKEIKENQAFYCLSIKQNDLEDIKILERIKPQLNNARILSMLIWQTFYQKPMTNLCNNVVGTDTKCGIYKITNQKNDMCYIGQSVDIAKRWKDHAKCGLGIDTPQNNKLYQAMIEDGLWNFSFEVLEECPREQLDEKEKYYISLYQAKDYSYNSTKGNK